MVRLLSCLLLIALLAGCAGPAEVAPPPPSASTLAVPAPTPTTPSTHWPAGGETLDLSTPAEPKPESLTATREAGSPVLQAQFVTVTVGSGDTLLGLAMAHGVPMAAIQLQNGLGSDTVIQLGQELVIPPSQAWDGAALFWIVHQVTEGETVSGIAQSYGLSVAALTGANGLTDADLLSVGQMLILPLTSFAEDRPTAPSSAAASAGDVVPTEVPPEQAAAAAGPIVPPPAEVGEWPYEAVRIMNEVRAAHSLPPLVYNETLAQAAQIQANDCASRGWCSHTGSDGSDIKERILRVGYVPASWAECWALRLSPQAAIDIWMDEVPPNDPHRRTLLTTWLTEIGIGVAKGDWGYYFIAEFGKPLR